MVGWEFEDKMHCIMYGTCVVIRDSCMALGSNKAYGCAGVFSRPQHTVCVVELLWVDVDDVKR